MSYIEKKTAWHHRDGKANGKKNETNNEREETDTEEEMDTQSRCKNNKQ